MTEPKPLSCPTMKDGRVQHYMCHCSGIFACHHCGEVPSATTTTPAPSAVASTKTGDGEAAPIQV